MILPPINESKSGSKEPENRLKLSSRTVSKWVVSPEEEGSTLLAFLRKQCSLHHSVKALKRAIDQKGCTINGEVETFSSHRLKKGQTICLDPAVFEKKRPIAPLEVLYEDAFLLVCNKPAGLISDHRAVNKSLPSYRNQLRLVHRLDKETSGVLIVAKSKEAYEKLVELFRERKIKKYYLALVDGCVAKEQGIIDQPLGPKTSYQGQTIYQVVKKGKSALTYWKCLKRGNNESLLLCEIKTGRTHQLRVHLSAMGHPILGDHQYGKRFRSSRKTERHLLHAYIIAFDHPFLDKKIKVVAPIPSAMNVLQKAQ